MNAKDLLDKFDKITKTKDKERPLYYLLRAFESEVQVILEKCGIEDFHKYFRVSNVTGNPNIDLAIWVLLSESGLFWDLVFSENGDQTC